MIAECCVHHIFDALIVAELDYVGCYVDHGSRDLPYLHWHHGDMTNEACAAHCAGYTFFSTQVTSMFDSIIVELRTTISSLKTLF